MTYTVLAIMLIAGADLCAARPISLCSPPPANRFTEWGHNHATLDWLDTPLSALTGLARTAPSVPLDETLIEVFNLSDVSRPAIGFDDIRNRVRLAACLTGKTGRFHFDLPPGHYEVLASKPEMNSTSVLVTIDPRKGKRRNIEIPLQLGD